MKVKTSFKNTVVLLIIGFLLLVHKSSYAQFEEFENLEETTESGFIKKYIKDFFKPNLGSSPFQFNSNLNIEGRFNNTSGADQIQPPSAYGIYGNLNFKVYNINIPLSLSYVGNEVEYKNPDVSGTEIKQRVKNKYTRIGMSPYYKWVTLHAGHRSFALSEFTMQDLTVFGIGTELNPGKLKFKYFNGRLANATPVDINLLEPQFSIFERNAWGTQIGYGDEQNGLSINIFKGEDEQNSIIIDTTATINPAQNTAISLQGYKTINNFRFQGEFGRSSFTENTLFQSNDSNTPFPFSILNGSENNDTEYKNASKFGVSYSSDLFSLGVNYKRVDDGYQTMGVAFFNSNIVEYSLSGGTQLLNRRLQLNGNIGLQNDNISNLKEQTIQRFIGDLSVGYSAGAINLNLLYNNNSYSTLYLLNSSLDSLNAKIQTNVFSGSISYALNSESGYSQIFSLNGTSSDVKDINGETSSPTTFYSLDFNYGLKLPSAWNFNFLLGYNNTESLETIFDRKSIGLGLTKTFISKISLALQSNYIFLDFNQNAINTNTTAMNGLLSLDYRVSDHHALFTRLNIISRKAFDMTNPIEVQESIFRVGLKLSFDYTKKGNDEAK